MLRKLAIKVFLASIFILGSAFKAGAQVPPEFAAVFDIMTTDAGPASNGCRGCHVGPAEALGPWWGDTAEDVLATLEAGTLLIGGRMSFLAFRLENCEMPLGGLCWDDSQLEILRAWLILYETP